MVEFSWVKYSGNRWALVQVLLRRMRRSTTGDQSRITSLRTSYSNVRGSTVVAKHSREYCLVIHVLSYHWKVSNRLFCHAYTYRLRYGPVTIELLINNYYLYQLKLTAARLNKKGNAQWFRLANLARIFINKS